MTPTSIHGIDKPISPIALGTAFYRLETAELHFGVLDAFMASGGTVIDSARTYGQSEDVLGRWIAGRQEIRKRLVLISKCGHGPQLKLPEKNFAASVREELEATRETLNTDVVDLYILHRDNQEMPVWTILEPLHEALADGHVRALGASNWEYRRVIEANAWAEQQGLAGFAVVSNTLSLARPAAAFYAGLVQADPIGEQWHRDTGIPLLPWSSQARGFFTGAWTREMLENRALADPKTPTFNSRMLKVYATDENFERLRRAEELGARKGGYTAMEIGLAWLTHRPFPIIPVVGPRTVEELDSCRRSIELELTEEECKWLDLRD